MFSTLSWTPVVGSSPSARTSGTFSLNLYRRVFSVGVDAAGLVRSLNRRRNLQTRYSEVVEPRTVALAAERIGPLHRKGADSLMLVR